jgi:hypothetical protein
MDFDKARWVVIIEAVLLLVLQPVVALELGVPLIFLVALPLVGGPMVLLLGRLRSAASPLSSSLIRCEWWALGAQLSWTLWWIFALGVKWL